MITEAQRAEIRRLFYAEHWRIGTIASELGLHPVTVRAALETARFNRRTVVRPSRLDPYTDFIRTTLEQYPKLRERVGPAPGTGWNLSYGRGGWRGAF